MKFVSKIGFGAVLIAISAATATNAAPARNAGEVSISNQTSSVLSFSINNACSNDIGNVNMYSIRNIPIPTIIKACGGNVCTIQGYNRPDCLGDTVGGEELGFQDDYIVSMRMFAGTLDYVAGGSISPDSNAIFYSDHLDQKRKLVK